MTTPNILVSSKRPGEDILDHKIASKHQKKGSSSTTAATKEHSAPSSPAGLKVAIVTELSSSRSTSSDNEQLLLPRLPEGFTATTPSLLGIPLELREKVYCHLFLHREPVRGRDRGDLLNRLLCVALTSKQLYEEATKFSYGSNTFILARCRKKVPHPQTDKAYRDNITYNPLPPSPDYTQWPREDIDNLLEDRALRVTGPRGGTCPKAKKIADLQAWDQNRQGMPTFELTKRWLLNHADFPADGHNTLIMDEEVFSYQKDERGNIQGDHTVTIINLPHLAVRPLIKSIAIEVGGLSIHGRVLLRKIEDAYSLRREHGFTGLKNLRVVIYPKPMGAMGTIDFELPRERHKGGYTIPSRVSTVTISMGRHEIDRDDLLEFLQAWREKEEYSGEW